MYDVTLLLEKLEQIEKFGSTSIPVSIHQYLSATYRKSSLWHHKKKSIAFNLFLSKRFFIYILRFVCSLYREQKTLLFRLR
jgi:hypothetical protein